MNIMERQKLKVALLRSCGRMEIPVQKILLPSTILMEGVQMWGHVERAHANSLKEAAKKKEFYSDIKTKYKDKFQKS